MQAAPIAALALCEVGLGERVAPAEIVPIIHGKGERDNVRPFGERARNHPPPAGRAAWPVKSSTGIGTPILRGTSEGSAAAGAVSAAHGGTIQEAGPEHGDRAGERASGRFNWL